MTLNKQQLSTILAGLRLWQWQIEDENGIEDHCKDVDQERMDAISSIATDDGALGLMHPGEIDALCEALNCCKPVELTGQDWTEIYCALDSKIRLIKNDGDGQEQQPQGAGSAAWIAHLQAIREKSGPDGEQAASSGVAPVHSIGQ